MKEINEGQAVFHILQEFGASNESYIDWHEVMEDENLLESILNSLEQIVGAICLLDTNLLSPAQQKEEVYTLSLKRAQLIEAYAAEDVKTLESTGAELEKLVRKFLTTGTWLNKAQELFPAFDKVSNKELTPKERIQFKSIQLLIGVFSLISVHEFAQFTEDDEEPTFSFNDGDYDEDEESDDELCCDHDNSIDA